MIETGRQFVAPDGSHDGGPARRSRASMQLLVTLNLLSLALILCAVPIRADEASMWAGSAMRPVPEGAKVTLELDRPDYFLGENVLVHFVLQNTGDALFEASWGGNNALHRTAWQPPVKATLGTKITTIRRQIRPYWTIHRNPDMILE